MPTPPEYNEKRYSLGTLTDDHVFRVLRAVCDVNDIAQQLVTRYVTPRGSSHDWRLFSEAALIWQSRNDLLDDGMFGPASMQKYHDMYLESRVAPLAQAMLEVAREQLGEGEEHQNNAGKYIHMLRNFPYDDRYKKSVGNWCAFFASWCMRQASERLNTPTPFRLTWVDKRFGKPMPFGSAKWHVEQLAKHGKRVDSIEDVQPGDWIAKHRGRGNSKYGHIMIAETNWLGDHVGIIDGNRGKFPCKVKRGKYRGEELYLIARVL